MRKLIFLGTMLTALPVTASAPESRGGESFTTLFAQTCMAHFYSQDRLREEMAVQEFPVLIAEQSSFFLDGTPGTAWAVRIDGASYVVALRADNICAVFAQRAPVVEVQNNFTAMVSSGPPPLIVQKLNDISAGSNSGAITTVAYSWSRAGDKVQLVFTLTTSSSENAKVQAVASMSLANKA